LKVSSEQVVVLSSVGRLLHALRLRRPCCLCDGWWTKTTRAHQGMRYPNVTWRILIWLLIYQSASVLWENRY